jgi:adenine-specific DNA-methyltransferase
MITLMTDLAVTPTPSLLDQVDVLRTQATDALDQSRRSKLGQFMTPPPVARLMAAMLTSVPKEVRLLDAGAGVGSLTAAAIAHYIGCDEPPTRIEVVAYEVDPILVEYLARTLELCEVACVEVAVEFEARIEAKDFLADAAERLFSLSDAARFNCAIQNPPYRKIATDSVERAVCRTMGVEATNLYAAFLGATIHLLEDDADLVAITPRSFANGPYFRQFRRFLLERIALRRLHVFGSRSHAFRGDAVLQENLILAATKTTDAPPSVEITASETPEHPIRSRRVPWGRVVYEHDREQFIHLIDSVEGDEVAEQVARFDNYLHDLGISVSTGPVVDFRATEFLRASSDDKTVPLLYPSHLNGGTVRWPVERAKWNAFALTDESFRQTVPNGDYVLVKRFTAKEEPRRVVAAVYEADAIVTKRVGFENHLNYFHEKGHGLPLDLARGLTIYLNSSLVDGYFRQFSGHTQVNAADLRNIPYPTRERLHAVGKAIGTAALTQDEIDSVVRQYLLV